MLLLQVSPAPLFGRPDVRDSPDERRSLLESALSRNSALARDSPDERRSLLESALSQNSALVQDSPDVRRSPPESASLRNFARARGSPDERRSPSEFALSRNSARAWDSLDARRSSSESASSRNSARARGSPDARRSPSESALLRNSARAQPFVRSVSVLFRRSDRLGQYFAFLPLGTPFLRPAIQAGFGRSFDRCYDYVKHRERGKRGRHYALNYSGEGVSLLYFLGV